MTLTVEDRLALTDLVARYAACVDTRRVDDLLDLFAPDGALVSPDPPRTLQPTVERRGREQVREAMAGLAQVPVTVHALLGSVFDAAGDGATGRTACAAHHVRAGSDGEVRDVVWHLHYDDVYVRSGSGWLFAERRATVDTISVLPVKHWRG